MKRKYYLLSKYALSLHKGYKEAQGKPMKQIEKQCRWSPLAADSVRLNVDGAVFMDQQKTCVGIILRDSQCEVLMATSKKEFEVKDPTEIELLAIFRGLQLCELLGLQELVIESDYLLKVTELKQEQGSFAFLDNIIAEIKRIDEEIPELQCAACWKIGQLSCPSAC